MSNLNKFAFVCCLFIFFGAIVILPAVIRRENFERCIQDDWSDYTCDSCYEAVYHKPSPFDD